MNWNIFTGETYRYQYGTFFISATLWIALQIRFYLVGQVAQKIPLVLLITVCAITMFLIRDLVLFNPRDSNPGWIFSGSQIFLIRLRLRLCSWNHKKQEKTRFVSGICVKKFLDPGSGIKHSGSATLCYKNNNYDSVVAKIFYHPAIFLMCLYVSQICTDEITTSCDEYNV
jgi:hypothetical protein